MRIRAENCLRCPTDCGTCLGFSCGDGVCGGQETCTEAPGLSLCAQDCCPVGGCDHQVCETGTPLKPFCSSCAALVCDFDSTCCDSMWDAICVGHAVVQCGAVCSRCDNDGVCEASTAIWLEISLSLGSQ